MGDLNSTQLLLLGLIAAVVVFAGFARRFAISYPIVLVVAGLLLSLVPHLPRVRLPPDVVFLLFLPPLLFSAAWETSWREFKAQLVPISLLAFGLVFFTAFGVAVTAHHFMPGFDWRLGFLLGAIVSPTDALAAVSIARKVGMPQRIVDILEGESLLNDATGLLALQFGVQMITEGATPRLGHSLLELLWLVGGGVGVGLAFAMAAAWAERWVDDGPVEIVASFLIAYGSYLAGEVVHASGVMAVVACGLYMSRQSSTFFSPLVRLQAGSVWEATEFLLNGLVFMLIGLQLPYVLAGIQGYSVTRLALYGIGFSATLIVLRMLWAYPGAKIAYVIRKRFLHQDDESTRPTAKGVFVVGWTGMRGVVALAAAGSLPYVLPDGSAFPQRDMIIFLTYCVILVTLVVQGLTLPPLVRLLKLDAVDANVCEEKEARRILLQSAIDFLEKSRAEVEDEHSHPYDDLLHNYQHKLEGLEDCGPDTVGRPFDVQTAQMVMLQTVQREREELIMLRNSGRIGDAVRRTLERELDLSETRLALQAMSQR